MKIRLLTTALVVLGWLGEPPPARAGMPSVLLSDMARMRLQTISFFLLVLLLCAWAVQGIWNALRGDFPRLPRLSYRRALGLVALWGLLFLLVLTMISGARELMTPGVWKKQGLTYRLADEPPSHSPEETLEKARRAKLEDLRRVLLQYAQSHGGRYPSDDRVPEISAEMWQVPDPSGMRYLYVGGQEADRGDQPLAYEPGLFGGERLVLRTDGVIAPMSLAAIRQALAPGRP
jgi:hypothetical protein